MNIIDLIVLVCSLVNANACTEKHLRMEMDGSLYECSVKAPPYLAQWVNEHPNYRIARWHCAFPDMEEREG